MLFIQIMSVTRFHVLRARIHFGGTKGVGSRFHVLRVRTHFRRYRGRPVSFSCFARPNSFSTITTASCPAFMFCAPGLIFDGTDSVVSHYHVLRFRTRFRRCGGRRVPFSCFARPYSFSVVPRASGPVFMFCAHVLVFDGNEGIRSRFHILCALTRFRRCRVRRVMFSCFARPDSFSAVPRASAPIFIFCAPGLIFGGTEGVGLVFMFCVPVLIFDGAKGVRSRFHVFWRCRGHSLLFSCFALPDSFSAVSWALAPIFMFCATRHIFDGAEGVGSHFHVLHYHNLFRRYRGRRVPFSCFACPNSFSAVPRASTPIFMF
jgi:hypothetical protein